MIESLGRHVGHRRHSHKLHSWVTTEEHWLWIYRIWGWWWCLLATFHLFLKLIIHQLVLLNNFIYHFSLYSLQLLHLNELLVNYTTLPASLTKS
jgi:hypothetical protein